MNKEVLKKIGIYAGILLLFIALAYSYTPQVLEGKIVNQSDIASWKGMANEAVKNQLDGEPFLPFPHRWYRLVRHMSSQSRPPSAGKSLPCC